MRSTLLLLPCLLLVGCRAVPPPGDGPDDARIRELEARLAWLEGQVRAATVVDDEILALQVRRAGMLVSYAPEHPVMVDIERKLEALEKVRALEDRARRDAMRRRLEAERDMLLGRYAPDHPSVRKIDAQISFLSG